MSDFWLGSLAVVTAAITGLIIYSAARLGVVDKVNKWMEGAV